MSTIPSVLVEGYSPEELLALPAEDLDSLILIDTPVVFRVGSAEILGQFRLKPDTLVMELAQIDGGGEGVLPALWLLAERYARQRNLSQVEWLVHAIYCAKPNLKLRRILQRRGFVIEELPETGEVYRLVHRVKPQDEVS
jgi:hypothetical protein